MVADDVSRKASQPIDRVAIGIAFGNSNSSIAYTTGADKAQVIANEDGDRQIPNIIAYVDGEEYYGLQAKQQLVRNHQNTVAYFRDFLGQDFKSIDPTHCHASAHPIEHDNTVAFKVKDQQGDEASSLTVSEVATRAFRRLRSSASDYLGKDVNSAVITVPTNFTAKQRESITKAASDAGLEVLQLIHEPIAALLAHDAKSEEAVADKIVVVADIGGTRSDVAVVASRGGMYTILSSVHDYEFAGVQLDKAIQDHFSKDFIKWHSIDPRENQRSLAKLKLEAEACKKALSIGNNASFSVESLAEGNDYASTINRIRYETVARKVFEGLNRLIESAVKKADLDVLDISEVLLSGGSSHTPRLASGLAQIFPDETVIHSPSTSTTAINPSELQARGAALQASLIQEYEADDIEQSTHAAVTTVKHLTKAIGVVHVTDAAEKGTFTPIIASETAAPCRRAIHIPAPKQGGDVLVQIVEASRHIKVTKPEPKAKSNANKADDEEEDESSDEEEDVREQIWQIGDTLGEAAVRGVKEGGKVEVTINVTADLAVTVTAREVGGKQGVRGQLKAS